MVRRYKKTYKKRRYVKRFKKFRKNPAFIVSRIRPELKFYDEINNLSVSSIATGTSGIISLVQGMIQGVGAAQFQGNTILLRSIYLSGQMAVTGGAGSSLIRCCIILDTTPSLSGGVPAYNEIFKLAYTTTSDFNTPLNLDEERYRYKVLWDKKFMLGTDGGLKNPFLWKKYLKCSIPIGYNTIPTPTKNNLYFVSLSNQPTNTVGVTIQSRLRYYDN